MPSIDEENDNFEFHQEICKAEAEDQIVVCSSDRSESDDGMEDVRLPAHYKLAAHLHQMKMISPLPERPVSAIRP